MAAIDIGPGASSDLGGNSGPLYTGIVLGNPANDSGTLTSFEIWMRTDGTGVKLGTFYGSSTTYTNRDYEDIGNVTSGSKQTFTGKSCTVSSGDYLGRYTSTGNTSAAEVGGGSGLYYKAGDFFGAGETSGYTAGNAAFNMSLYATGETVAAGWTTAKLGGVASASIIKVGGIAVGSVKKVMGVSVQE